MLKNNFHIQRGDDVQTPPKNDVFQSFNLQSKWGVLEAIILADGDNPHAGHNRLTQLAVRNALAHLRERAKTAGSIEAALEEALQAVHQELRAERLRSEELLDQSADLAIALINGDSVYVAETGRLAIYQVKENSVNPIAGLEEKSGAFGIQADFEPAVKGPISLVKGEDLVIASDGLNGGSAMGWKAIRKEEMLETLKNETDLKRAAKRLVSYPLGRNVEEDVSVAIIRNPQKEKANRSVLLIPAVIGLALLAFFAYQYISSIPPEEDLYTVLDSSGDDYTIAVTQNSNGESSALASTTYDISTGGDWLSLQIKDSHLSIGPGANVQIEDEERFLADVARTSSWIFLQNAHPQQLLTIKFGEYRLDLQPPQPGSVGVRSNSNETDFYCFAGSCLFLAPSDAQRQPINAGWKAALIDGNYSLEEITPDEIIELEQMCSCSLN